ncbi:hypothetical protein AB4Y40_30805 [Paraburkholderia sp. EG287B]|uniref:hypothetical protein n=1 Tax=Paraburkholderia sp. EG287B TaxID=3237010 RepID=UPI0034D1C575
MSLSTSQPNLTCVSRSHAAQPTPRQTPHLDVPSHQNLNDKLKRALQGHRGTAVQEMARRSTPKFFSRPDQF